MDGRGEGAASEAQETEKSATATELSEAAKDEEKNAKLRAAQRRIMSSTASVSMFQRATDRHAVEAEARRAYRAGELLPWGQPPVDTDAAGGGGGASGASPPGSPSQRRGSLGSPKGRRWRAAAMLAKKSGQKRQLPKKSGWEFLDDLLGIGYIDVLGGGGGGRGGRGGRGGGRGRGAAGAAGAAGGRGGAGQDGGGRQPSSPGRVSLAEPSASSSPGPSASQRRGSLGGALSPGRRSSSSSPMASPDRSVEGGGESPGGWSTMTGSLLGALAEAGDMMGVKADWSTRIRHVRQAMALRSMVEARRLLADLHAKARRELETTPVPTRALGVTLTDESLNQPSLEHAWMAARPARLAAALRDMEDDPRRRFVMGRQRYEEDVRERVAELLSGLEADELPYEDGAIASELLQKQQRARFSPTEAAPDLVLGGAAAAARADALCWELFKAGYNRVQAATVMHALFGKETHLLRKCHALFEEGGAGGGASDSSHDGGLDRARLIFTARLLKPATPIAQWERFERRLHTLAQSSARTPVGFNEFASLLRILDLGGGGGAVADVVGHMKAQKASAQAMADLMATVPPRLRKRCRTMRTAMAEGGYPPREVLAVLRAMFTPPPSDDAVAASTALREAWAVFDPLGRGRLTLGEFAAAFALLGSTVPPEDIEREFRKIDVDGSGYIELAEFGLVLKRLATLAKGAPKQLLHSGATATLASGLGNELRLLQLLDAPTRKAVPLSHHGFAARILANMKLYGFEPHHATLVLSAVFDPHGDSGDWDARRSTPVRRAWLLLGGVDWSRARILENDEPADDALLGAAAGGDAATGGRRRASTLTAALSGGDESLPAELLRGCRAPRRHEFKMASTLRLADFKKLVEVFGDYRADREMWNCQAELAELFELLGDGGGIDGAGSADPEADGVFLGFDEFVDFVKRLSPHWEGDDQLDDALMELVSQIERPPDIASQQQQHEHGVAAQQVAQLTATGGGGGGGGVGGQRGSVSFDPAAKGGGGAGGGGGGGWSKARQSLNSEAMTKLMPSAVQSARKARASLATTMQQVQAQAKSAMRNDVDVLETLDRESKALLPVAHLEIVKAIFNNLRAAGFQPKESNVLVRALYSWNDDLSGDGMRRAAWRLLAEHRVHLRTAADKLADEVGEFRHEKGRYTLAGLQAARPPEDLHGTSGVRRGGKKGKKDRSEREAKPAPPVVAGLNETETQFLVCVLGEHLADEQVHAIFSALDFSERPVLPFEPDVAKILKFMNPLLHRRDVKQMGTILDNDSKAHEFQDALHFIDDEGDAERVSALQNPLEFVKVTISQGLQAVHEANRKRQQEREAHERHKAREAEQFTSWFGAMGNNQLKMKQELTGVAMHFG